MSVMFTGKAGVNTFVAISLKHGLRLYAATGLKPNSSWTPSAMLAKASQITGNKYARRDYASAISDLTAWIAANGTTGEDAD